MATHELSSTTTQYVLSALFWIVVPLLSIYVFGLYNKIVVRRYVERELEEISEMLDKVVDMMVARAACSAEEARTVIRRASEAFIVPPVQLDPHGIIDRLENLVDRSEEKFRSFARVLAGGDEDRVNDFRMSLVAVMTLSNIKKLIEHWLLTASKMGSWQILLQLKIIIPVLKEYALSNYHAAKAFLDRVPVGDSVGPMVAAYLIGDRPVREVEKETVAAEFEHEGRRVVVVKAHGPSGSLGKIGRAVRRLIREYGDVSKVITVDAALKLEGEPTGKVSEGVGVAMGDPGHESYKIEEIAAEEGVDLDAVVIKMSATEAVIPMKKEIADAVPEAADRVLELVEEAPEDTTVIVVGVGNTVGVPDNKPYVPEKGAVSG